MSAPKMDALDVLRREVVQADVSRDCSAESLRMTTEANAAITAVAALIEVATSALYDMREVRDRCCISLEMVGLDEQIEESIGRLATALARVGDDA